MLFVYMITAFNYHFVCQDSSMKFKMQLFSTQTHGNLNELYFDVIKVKLIIIYKRFYNISWQYIIIIIYLPALISFIIHLETVYKVNRDWRKIVFSSSVIPIHTIPLGNFSSILLQTQPLKKFPALWMSKTWANKGLWKKCERKHPKSQGLEGWKCHFWEWFCSQWKSEHMVPKRTQHSKTIPSCKNHPLVLRSSRESFFPVINLAALCHGFLQTALCPPKDSKFKSQTFPSPVPRSREVLQPSENGKSCPLQNLRS